MYNDCQVYISDLEKRGQLKRITASVDPILEISAIADRVSKMPAAGGAAPPGTDPVHGGRGGHALLFTNVKGSSIPVAINTFGSYERVRLALGVQSFEELADRMQQLIKPEMPTTILEKLRKLPQLAKLASFGPKVGKRGMCQEVVHTDDANLFDLPIIQCWPRDGEAGYGGKPRTLAIDDCRLSISEERPDVPIDNRQSSIDNPSGTGRYITLAGIYTKDPESGERNVGMYRVQVYDRTLAAMHWHMHHDGARHFRKYKKRGEKMPLAIVLGGEPVLTYAATCPLPPDMSELLFAGFLNEAGIEMVPCKTIPLEVPANAEIVIEGWV
ncbi:MAG: UbiD family decarboxylase domain-containing protein, partial [Methylocella sp.]